MHSTPRIVYSFGHLEQGVDVLRNKFNTEVRCFTSVDALIQAVTDFEPTAILFNTYTNEELEQISNYELMDDIPRIFVCSGNSPEDRLIAAKFKAIGYYTLPVDIAHLANLLDAQQEITNKNVCFVVAGPDSERNQKHVAYLNELGLQANAETSPHEALLHILNHDCENIILITDYNLGENFTGIDLARAARHVDAFTYIPIFLLVDKLDDETLAEILHLGSIYILPSTIDSKLLYQAVDSEMIRTTRIRHTMLTDSMTGLYRKVPILRMIELAINQIQRNPTPMSICMLDLDHFKQVNDTWGHLEGDRVLIDFAAFLKSKLRNTDLIGRYGGEEFVIIMTNATSDQSKMVLDRMLDEWSSIERTSGTGDRYHVSFSAGIVQYSKDMTTADLISEADKMLYKAKNSGRRLILTA